MFNYKPRRAVVIQKLRYRKGQPASRKPALRVEMLMRLLDYAIQNDAHREVLDVLGRGIEATAERINHAGSDEDEYADAVAGMEIEIIEGLLGAAYVVCQTHITAVVQAALRCRKQIITDGRAFSAFGDRDYEVRRMGPRFDAQWSKIELLWALANYFKHRDQWSPVWLRWTNPQGLEQHTVPVILAAGLQRGSNGNLRQGAEALGNPGYADTSVFQAVIRQWADQVREAIRRAIV